MIRFAVDHPVATWMLFTALIVTGVYALPRLNIEAMPETELPELSIVTSWNGASPSAIQRSVTLPIEEAVAGCHGVEDLDSQSRHGQSSVTVKYKRGTDMEFARLELSERLGAVRRTLPAQAGQPYIRPYVPEELRTEEFFSVSLISPLSMNDLRDRAETWLVPRFLAIPGVADAELRGGARPMIKVLLDLELMERYGLTADLIAGRLDALDDITPAGAVRRSGLELTVSVQEDVSLRMLEDTVLRTIAGQPVTLGHVARAQPDFEDISYYSRINGENVITLNVTKRSGQNSISVSRRLRAEMPRIEAEAPFAVTFEVDQDEGEDLEEKLEELVIRSLIILGLLFILLAIALKQVRLTGIVIFSILLAIVICLSLFYFFGVSVNFITISGLTVCFGMLLDNSILVLDAIHRRLTGRWEGDSRLALIRGTREVAFPIMATTLTTVVAFLSFIFMTDRLSLFYVPLAVSVGIAMLASIFVAFAWIPVALKGPAEKGMGKPKANDEEAGFVGSAGFVNRLTRMHLKVWYIPVLLTVGLFVGTFFVFKDKVRTGGFWRLPDKETIFLSLRRPVGTDINLTNETIKLFESEILPMPEGAILRSQAWGNSALLWIEFDERLMLSAVPTMIRNKLIVLAEEMGGMSIVLGGFGDPYFKGSVGGGQGNSTIRITGYNSKELKAISDGVRARLNRNRRVRNPRLTSSNSFSFDTSPETVFILDREVLAQHRLSMWAAMSHLQRMLAVETPWHMVVDGEDQRLMMTFDDSEALEYRQILGRTMTTPRGQKVMLGQMLQIEQRPVSNAIIRHNQRYSQLINWDYIGTDRMRRRFLAEIVGGIELPYGYTAEDMSGRQITEEEEEELRQTLWLTLAFIFMALAAMFESFFLPVLVLMSIPMALAGVGGIFWATGAEFDSSAKIGLILMFGIVVNNAILLINRFRLQVREILAEKNFPRGNEDGEIPEKRRLGGFDLWRLPGVVRQQVLNQAIVQGTRIQMRSILLTSGTTIAGLLPLLYKKDASAGKDIWENLALSSIGGLGSSTVLILMAIPALYWMFTRWGWGLARFGRWVRRRGAKVSTETPATDP